MNRIIGCPHSALVVVWPVHLYHGAMLCGDGVQVSVAVLCRLLFVAVEVGPCALHLAQLLLRCKVACLPVTSQLLVPHECPLLALTQAVDHLHDVPAQHVLLGFVLTAGKGKGHSRHVVARAVSFQLGGGRVPSVGLRIAVGRQSVGVAIIIQLLLDRQGEEMVDVEVAVPGEAVLAVDAHLVQRQWLGHNDSRFPGIRLFLFHHLHLCRYGIAVRRGVVAYDEAAHLIFTTHRIHLGVGLGFLCSLRGVHPSHLPVLAAAVGIRHP